MTQNWFLDFHCVYTFIQVIHFESIKVVRTDYTAFKSLSKARQKKAAAVVIIAQAFQKNKPWKKDKKVKLVVNSGFRERKTFVL